MVIVDAFTHYVALNPVPHCNAYYANTTLYEQWIAKCGLPEILVTDNGTEFINSPLKYKVVLKEEAEHLGLG